MVVMDTDVHYSTCYWTENDLFCPHRTKALVLELLAAVCLVRGGHDIILSAFDNFKEVREVPARTFN